MEEQKEAANLVCDVRRKSPWETRETVVVGRSLLCEKSEGGYGSGRWTSKESNNRYQVIYLFHVMI